MNVEKAKYVNAGRRIVLAAAASVSLAAGAAELSWPEPTREMKPWTYNWWMGSAVDEAGMEFQCRELAAKGFGGFHVIPIYGAKNGYESKWRKLLSPEWTEAWNMAARTARRHGLGIDLTMGSGWCFGGPWIDKERAASSGMKVKRAGAGGEGFMIDPFDPEAMKLHVSRFDALFGKNGTAERPRAFYHDSYEYYGAEPKHGEDVDDAQLACFRVWTDWCRENGYLTRNEAHGAPSNWLDFYALADIPETEMFGKNNRDILISKFASSAAHVKGTALVSAESCTWIDEHFRERPAEIKEFLDRLFLAGVNHIFYHGCCYSPVDAAWPGWCFYASLEMNPRNPIWREAGALNEYATRCQSLFQTWTPDNDVAIVWDPSGYRAKQPGKTAPMNIHKTAWFYGEPVGRTAKELYAAGYAFDYVSPRMVKAGMAEKYATVVDPAEYDGATAQRRVEMLKNARKTPFDAACGLLATRWKKDGETAYFVVNTGDVVRVVSAGGGEYGVMDPLSGEIETARRKAIEIAPKHSLFLVGGDFTVVGGEAPGNSGFSGISGPWKLSPVCGGPALPAPRTLDTLAEWETFDEFFSGTMLYKTEFDFEAPNLPEDGEPLVLSLGDVREIARARLNGKDLGVRFMAPYEFSVPRGLLKEKGNTLEIEATNLGANRLRWNDINKVDWKYFADINMVDMNYKKFDASGWKPLKSGLLGPVSIQHVPASGTPRERVDPRVRTFVPPARVVWTSGDAVYGNRSVVKNAESLLKPRFGQIPEERWKSNCGCVMENNGENASVLLDFGRELHGGIQIGGMCPRGMKMRVRFGESVGEAMSGIGTKHASNDHAIRDGIHDIPFMGTVEIGNTGFRFVRLDLVTAGKANLECVRAVSLMRPMPRLGGFKCSDERLNRVWETAVRTVHLCCQDFLWDGIKRDRLVWLGDMHPEARAVFSVFGASEVLSDSIDYAIATTPADCWMNNMPNYTLWFLRVVREWYRCTGDTAWVRERGEYLKATVAHVLENVRGENAAYGDGPGSNVFLDWPTQHNKPAVRAGTRGLLALALDDAGELMDVAGDAALAAKCRDEAAKVRTERPDPAGAKPAAALLALGGLADAKEMFRDVIGKNGHDGVSTFYGYYMLEAMSAAGENQRALDTVRDYWGGMLDMGATSFWEDFNLSWTNNASRLDEMPVQGRKDIHGDFGEFCYPGYRHSLCHGWSAGPAAWCIAHVLGLEALDAGGKTVRVKPFLGDLDWAEGSLPTAQGVVRVRHEKRPDGSIDTKIDAPPGVTLVR